MCGIIGYVGKRQAVPVLLEGLRKLEYRGYDSAGVAVLGRSGIEVRKAAGKLFNLEERIYHNPPKGTVGIGHTRWATHGKPDERNAHPHLDSSGRLALVHNGILENYPELAAYLKKNKGIELRSETDSEAIAHLLGSIQGKLHERALRVMPMLRGQFAVVAVVEGENRLLAFKYGPPLVVGIGEGECFVASDVVALLERTRRVIFLEDGDVAVVGPGNVEVYDSSGSPAERSVEEIRWDPSTAEKGGYRHYMLKEIHEQPEAVRNTLTAYVGPTDNAVSLEDVGFTQRFLSRIRRVDLVACGTSWHASLVAERYIESLWGIPARAHLASEYRYRNPRLDSSVLVVGVTQSGETADTLAAMRLAKKKGAFVGAICNVRGSAAMRTSEASMLIQAGPEIGVASTKAFTCQLVALLMLAMAGAGRKFPRLITALRQLPHKLEEALTLAQEGAESAADLFQGASSALYLGRGLMYPMALEGALKMKEISYVHAEGYPAGEMKHGPIALISDGFPVVTIPGEGRLSVKTLANVEEVKARGARVIAVGRADVGSDALVKTPSGVHPLLLPMVVAPALQLLAYFVAVARGADVDQPRNLAKSVTVE